MSQANNPFLPPQLYAPEPQLTPTDFDLLQPTYGIPNLWQESTTFVAKRQGTPQIFQQKSRPLKLSAVDAVAPWNIVN